MKVALKSWQRTGIHHLLAHRYATLFWSPGCCKTLTVLLSLLMVRERRIPNAKILVIAPLKVARLTWPREIRKWDPTSSLKYVYLHGPKKDELLTSDADIYIINFEGLKWLFSKLPDDPSEGWPFQGLVVDELTKFKDTKTQRYREMKKRLWRFKFRWGLTGTPAPNHLIELFGQMMVIDGGVRLGPYKGKFIQNYFYQPSTYNPYEWVPRRGAERAIQAKISDVCHYIDPKDVIAEPRNGVWPNDPLTNIRPVELPADVMKLYREFENNLCARVDLSDISAANAAVLVGKLQQITQGFMYRGEESPIWLHEAKLDALEELVDEMQGDPLFVIYWFNEDLVKLRQRFPKGVTMDNKNAEQKEADWNAGKIEILFVNPGSAGHGLNMQESGSTIVWYTLNHSNEKYIQTIGRVHRSGQRNPVTVHHLVAEGTIDGDIMATIESRDHTQRKLLEGLRRRVSA